MTECLNTEKTEAKKVAFTDLDLSPTILNNLEKAGFETPTDIQSNSIPYILEKRDVTAQAKTGSGKTLAFCLPTIQHIENGDIGAALVLVPTRELAEQVAGEFQRFGKGSKNLKVACVIGKQSYSVQIRSINHGANAVIATPGRLIDLLESGKIKNFSPDMLVLDEADEMLNMGFIDDIKKVFTYLPEERQTVFFSATFPPQIKKLAQDSQRNPAGVYLNNGKEKQDNELIEQSFYVVSERERESALIRLIEFERPEKAIVFCRTKRDVDELQSRLMGKGIKAKALHGDMGQSERTNAIKQFKSGFITTLIATDVASRGIDVSDVTHVFNYHIPENRDRYTHRIGRTGRAGKSGKAMTITTRGEWSNHFFLRGLNKKTVKLKPIPSSEKVQKHLDVAFMDKLKNTGISDEARNFCEKMMKDEDSFELLCKFFAMTSGERKIDGPERIGLDDRDLSFILSAKPSFGGGRSGGGFSRGGRSRFGGGRDRFRGSNDRGPRSFGGGSDSGRGQRSFGGRSENGSGNRKRSFSPSKRRSA